MGFAGFFLDAIIDIIKRMLWFARITITGTWIIYLAAFLVVKHGHNPTKLQTYNIDEIKVTTSGISSGGIMATQFHFAHSKRVYGSGVFAGVPYMCGFGGLLSATTCMFFPRTVNVPLLIFQANLLAIAGRIDPTSNLAGDPVYIYHGSKDSIVRPASGENVKTIYKNYGTNLVTKFDIPGEHAQPTDNYGSKCGESGKGFGYITNCGYNGAFDMLNHLNGGSLKKPDTSTKALGQIIQFDQTEFTTVSHMLSTIDQQGYVYVPTRCQDGRIKCALHIAFHGCAQNRQTIGDTYVKHAGYLEVAELNNIIILFPQTIDTPLMGNPHGCWDWWAYSGIMYAWKQGEQISSVFKMVERLVGHSLG